MKNRICFVCLGNICRSPMAEYMMKEKLREKGIPFERHYAKRVEKEDFHHFDYFICMEEKNIRELQRIIGKSDKIIKLLERDISDPWYTGEFEKTYQDLDEGLELFFKRFLS